MSCVFLYFPAIVGAYGKPGFWIPETGTGNGNGNGNGNGTGVNWETLKPVPDRSRPLIQIKFKMVSSISIYHDDFDILSADR